MVRKRGMNSEKMMAKRKLMDFEKENLKDC